MLLESLVAAGIRTLRDLKENLTEAQLSHVRESLIGLEECVPHALRAARTASCAHAAAAAAAATSPPPRASPPAVRRTAQVLDCLVQDEVDELVVALENAAELATAGEAHAHAAVDQPLEVDGLRAAAPRRRRAAATRRCRA